MVKGKASIRLILMLFVMSLLLMPMTSCLGDDPIEPKDNVFVEKDKDVTEPEEEEGEKPAEEDNNTDDEKPSDDNDDKPNGNSDEDKPNEENTDDNTEEPDNGSETDEPSDEPEEDDKPNKDDDEAIEAGFTLAEIKQPAEGKDLAIAMKFTGQLCGPCGSVAQRWDRAAHENKDLIVVNLHGFSNYSPKFNNSLAGSYASAFRVNGLPTVLANGKGQEIDYRYPIQMQRFIDKPPLFTSRIYYKIEGDNLKVRFKSSDKKEHQYQSLKLLYWLIEDGIEAYQSQQGYNYVHNHVFRDAPLGLWGENYKLGTSLESSFNFTTNVDNKENVQLVCMLINSSARVLYVTQFPIK